MKNYITLLICCTLLAPLSLSARHILGGSMGYYHTTTGQLVVEMVLYRDCGGGGAYFDNPAEIAVYSPTGQIFTTFHLTQFQVDSITLNPGTCSYQPLICVERGRYTFPLLLPDDDSSYLVVYQRCCRAEDLTNLVTPAEVGYTVGVEITPQARSLKNNSPRWIADPTLNICPHQAATVNLAATEPDGDLLVYSFCSPWAGGGNILQAPDVTSCLGALPTPPCPPPYDFVPFATPNYSFNNPLGSFTSQLNQTNGEWNINPDFVGKFNYGACVDEYRNGQLLSNTRLDRTIFVKDMVGTDEAEGSADLTFLPNPATESEVFFSTRMFEGKNIQIDLADLSGKIWLSEKRSNTAQKERLLIGQLPPGIYLVKILADGKTAVGRFVRY